MGDSCAVSAPLLESSQTRIQVDPDADKSPFCMARDTLFNKLSFAPKSKYDIPAAAAASNRKRTKAEQEYYEKQLATLKSFEEVDSLCEKFQTEELKELECQEDAQREFGVNIAVNISNIANVLLLLFKIYATVNTGSLAVAASTLDSLLDLIAGAILWFTNRSMTNTNIYKYPIGKLRVQPVGIIIFAVVMATLASLVGQSASPEMLQKLTYLVLSHDPVIKHVDTVRAYTFGVLYFVEVDIELPDNLPLKEAHTIGESLQIKLESLEEVERAFVHLDFESEHKPEHSVLAKLPSSQP
uniref:Uncharacterized protein n=1 Tax=Araucaria cunninghamii TaxID=56994 RepID=A0A0D6QSQ3_ARACU